MKAFCTSAALCIALTAKAFGVPQSDGSIFLETFTNYPEHPLSQAVNVGAVITDGTVRITTETATEGFFRASPLPISSGQEYVVEFDWILHAPSGDNFYMFYSQGPEEPYLTNISLRTIPMGDNWIFQIDHGIDPFYEWSELLNYNQPYHVTLHMKPSGNAVALYVDGLLINEYFSQNPSLTTDLMQWGDGSGGAGYGNATLDNISIGLPAAEIDTDYNEDGFIDGADYVAWRKGDINGAGGYQSWVENYGTTVPGSGGSTGVPEPTSALLLLIGTVFLRWCNIRLTRTSVS